VDRLAHFEPEQTWVLEPGDMLYLPPGVAHHGVALEPCMTYSIGLRAPSVADLALALGEWLAAGDDPARYTDPRSDGLAREPAPRRGEVARVALDRLRGLLLETVSDERRMDEFLAAFLSRFRMAHEPVADPDLPSRDVLGARLSEGAAMQRNPWSRLTWIERDDRARLYAAGMPPRDCRIDLATRLCGPLGQAISLPPDSAPEDLACALQLLESGHFYLVRED
jgi:50S ribosomal protein L16 3-hydroxylase